MLRRPPRSTRTDTLFPYTTLFRSVYRNDPAISTTVLYQGGLPAGVPFSNQYGYDDPTVNQIIADAAVTIDPAARTELYRRSEEHTSELQSLMRISYAVFCLKKKTTTKTIHKQQKTAYTY